MNNDESKNLVWALLFLIFGIILLVSDKDILETASNILGIFIAITGIIKGINYVYLKGKLGDYSTTELAISILLIMFGVSLLVFSKALSLTIRLIFGLWALFAGINKIVFAINIKSVDKNGFITYLSSAIIMIIVGILLVSNLLGNVIGLLIIIYSVCEIIDYIYYNSNKNKKNYPKNKSKNNKSKKEQKVIEAVIEE